MKINDSDVFESFTNSFVVHYLARARIFAHCNKKNLFFIDRVCKNDSALFASQLLKNYSFPLYFLKIKYCDFFYGFSGTAKEV